MTTTTAIDRAFTEAANIYRTAIHEIMVRQEDLYNVRQARLYIACYLTRQGVSPHLISPLISTPPRIIIAWLVNEKEQKLKFLKI